MPKQRKWESPVDLQHPQIGPSMCRHLSQVVLCLDADGSWRKLKSYCLSQCIGWIPHNLTLTWSLETGQRILKKEDSHHSLLLVSGPGSFAYECYQCEASIRLICALSAWDPRQICAHQTNSSRISWQSWHLWVQSRSSLECMIARHTHKPPQSHTRTGSRTQDGQVFLARSSLIQMWDPYRLYLLHVRITSQTQVYLYGWAVILSTRQAQSVSSLSSFYALVNHSLSTQGRPSLWLNFYQLIQKSHRYT